MKRLLAVVAGLAIALVGTIAVAAWLSTGSAGGSVAAGSLAAPTAVIGSHTNGTGDVQVSWTASAGTPTPTGYYVLRTPADGPVEPACGSSVSNPVTGVTSCTDSGVPLGTSTYTVVAVFHSWTRASQASAGVTVGKADQVVTITSSPTSPTFGGSYTVTATGGGSANPIVFGTSTPGVCTVSGASVSFLHAGACTVTADQSGTTYFNAGHASQSFSVAKAAQVITYTSTAPTNAVVGGAGYAPAATGGGSGNPVTFTIDASSSNVCSVSAGVVTYQHAGTCVVDADQAGNADYSSASTVPQSIAVGPGAQAINFTSTAPSNAKVNGSYTVSATGGASGNAVVFSSADPSVCTVSGSSVSFVAAGTCTINANQAGTSDYLAATQVQQSFGVTRSDQTISFTSSAPSSATVGGATYTVAATATSGLTVTFSSASTSVCTVSGTTVSFVGAGTCTINADQSGNTAYNPALQKQQSFTVAAGGPPPVAPKLTGCAGPNGSNPYTLTWTWSGTGSPNGGFKLYYTNLSGGTTINPTNLASSPGQTVNLNSVSGRFELVAVVNGVESAPATATFVAQGSKSCTIN